MEELEIVEVPLQTILQIRQQVMYPGISLEMQQVDTDMASVHLGVKMDNEIVSVISLYEHGGELQFRKFATLQKVQGRGIGSYLLEYVFETAKRKGCRSVWCNARMNAIRLYQKFRMEPFSEKWFEKGFEFVKMRYEIKENNI
ncbi:GNAT family N-acetyltransferase [Polluticaenibacter yanchengensis]|uniref:GNAT family N-acetyltransferase n=1 Tax=Polluticaenibacter yanchengensis TaxID=3014562 RepID=A0ABT4UNM3_9BACT|nr:GNAT family N-acetyltransferase [Chitinophagaceae bacterium LY-5]